MALNIKDKGTEALVNKIASLTGETQTEAVRQAASERLARLEEARGGRYSADRRSDYDPRESAETFRRFMETEIWPLIPAEHRGKPPMTKAEREEVLGYGPDGV
jgi:antitoxin VapB